MISANSTAGTATTYGNMNPSSTTADVYVISGRCHFIAIDEYDDVPAATDFFADLEPVIFDRCPVELWPDLYEDAPHRVPNHYLPAPRKMLPKRISGSYRKPLKLKQPVARSGFKRGQRR